MKLVVNDDHEDFKVGRHATMPGVPWQRCQFHTSQNAMTHVPKMAMRAEVADDIRRIFNVDDRAEAHRRLKVMFGRNHKTAPRTCQLARGAKFRSLDRLRVPGGSPQAAANHKRPRTTQQAKEAPNPSRHLVPNRASLLRLVSAVLSEISDDWEKERSYLDMNAR